MTASSITMYETADAGFSRVPTYNATTLTTLIYWGHGSPAESTEWRDIVTARLAELERLAPGWDSEGALPVGRRHANRAIQFLVRLMATREAPVAVPDIIPLADGGVQLEWHMASGRRIDFVSDDGSDPVILVQDAESLDEAPAHSIDIAAFRALFEP
jgi:hypothetical protein